MPFHIIFVLRLTLYYTELIGITCIIYIYIYINLPPSVFRAGDWGLYCVAVMQQKQHLSHPVERRQAGEGSSGGEP